MRVLVHFPFSPFARRVRLALAHKGLEAELRDGRADPRVLEEMRGRAPYMTVPLLVEPDGRILGESMPITQYLDRRYSWAAPIWPTGPDDAFEVSEVTALVDAALEALVALGNRFHRFDDHPGWDEVKRENMRRVQPALDMLAMRVAALARPTIHRGGWSGADMWLYTMIVWLRGLPGRARTFPIASQILSLGWRLPDELLAWADQHGQRPDTRALEPRTT